MFRDLPVEVFTKVSFAACKQGNAYIKEPSLLQIFVEYIPPEAIAFCEDVCVGWRDWIDVNIRKSPSARKKRRKLCKCSSNCVSITKLTGPFLLLVTVHAHFERLSDRLLTETEYMQAVRQLARCYSFHPGGKGAASNAWARFPLRERVAREAGSMENIRDHVRKIAARSSLPLQRLARIIGIDATRRSGGSNALVLAVELACQETVRLLLRNAVVDVNAECERP